MTIKELCEKRNATIEEMKNMDAIARVEKRSLTSEEQYKFDSLQREVERLAKDIEEERAEQMRQGFSFTLPKEDIDERGGNYMNVFNRDSFLGMAKEQRSLVLNGSGAVAQIQQLFKEEDLKDTILDKVRFFYGPNAMTEIPVVTAFEEPDDYEEGATNVSDDTTSSLYVTTLKSKAYSKVLPVTAEMLNLSFVDTEKDLMDLFAKAFFKVIHKGILVGSGENNKMKGIFVSAISHTAGQTTLKGSNITLGELANLALSVAQKDDEYTIIMNLATYQKILADTTNGEDIKLYKEGLIRDKSIEGVKIMLDPYAPSVSTAGAILAAAVPLQRYAVAIAGQLMIDPIKKKGDTNTYFQATMFFSGKQVTDKDVYSLIVAE